MIPRHSQRSNAFSPSKVAAVPGDLAPEAGFTRLTVKEEVSGPQSAALRNRCQGTAQFLDDYVRGVASGRIV